MPPVSAMQSLHPAQHFRSRTGLSWLESIFLLIAARVSRDTAKQERSRARLPVFPRDDGVKLSNSEPTGGKLWLVSEHALVHRGCQMSTACVNSIVAFDFRLSCTYLMRSLHCFCR